MKQGINNNVRGNQYSVQAYFKLGKPRCHRIFEQFNRVVCFLHPSDRILSIGVVLRIWSRCRFASQNGLADSKQFNRNQLALRAKLDEGQQWRYAVSFSRLQEADGRGAGRHLAPHKFVFRRLVSQII